MSERRLVIGQPMLRRILEHCLEEKPLEACGILAGRDDRVLRAYAADNARRSPVQFEVDPEQQEYALREIAAQGDRLVAIYHSHPTAPATPSRNDINEAVNYPEAIRLIISLAGPMEVRAFLITEGRVKPVPLAAPPNLEGIWRDLRQGAGQSELG